MASFSDIELSPPNTGPAPLRLFKQLQLLKKVEKYSFFWGVRKISFYHKSSTNNKLLSSPEDPTLLKPSEFVPGHIKRCQIFIFFVCKCADFPVFPTSDFLTSSPTAPIFLLPGEKLRVFGTRSFGGIMGRSKIKGPVVFARRSFPASWVFPWFLKETPLKLKGALRCIEKTNPPCSTQGFGLDI